MIPIFDGLIALGQKALDLIPDPNKKAELAAEMRKQQEAAELQISQMQADIDKQEAASPNWFIAGWRPAVGWVCAVSLALYFWPRFLLGMFFWCKLCWKDSALLPLPEMGISDILGLLGSILGLGTLRTIEKAKDVEGNR